MNGYQLTINFANPPIEETSEWRLQCLENWKRDQIRLHHDFEPFYSEKKQLLENQ